MKNKIFKNIFLASMAVFISCLIFTIGAIYNYFSEQGMKELKNETFYIASAVDKYGIDFLKDVNIDTSIRVTLIDKDGKVLFDTANDPASMENHSNRQEVRQAFETGYGEDSRYSKTLYEKTSYCAVLLSNGTILRLSSSQYTIFILIGSMTYQIIIVILLAVALSLIFSARISKILTKPINNIDLESPDERDIYPELQPLVRRINAQNRQISRQMKELKMEHERQDKLRREFTANVSHELKTPLTSISGYAEIMRNGMVDSADIGRFSSKIYDESQRLMILIGDIIKLSQMDDKELAVENTVIDLYEVCQGVKEHLKSAAEKKNLTFNLQGNHSKITGVEQIIYEIAYNLCDNAIKYNKDNGKINVDITENENTVTLSVSDTGIGIPQEDIERIFERFYRVDKSHSKAVGGTGLGLSIVKHGATYHNAIISCESTLNIGTVIKITFPK